MNENLKKEIIQINKEVVVALITMFIIQYFVNDICVFFKIEQENWFFISIPLFFIIAILTTYKLSIKTYKK